MKHLNEDHLRSLLEQVLQQTKDVLEINADQAYEHYDEYAAPGMDGTPDFGAKRAQLTQEAKQQFQIFRDNLADLVTELCVNPGISTSLSQFVMNFPGPYVGGAHVVYQLQPGGAVGAVDQLGGQRTDGDDGHSYRGVHRKQPRPWQD